MTTPITTDGETAESSCALNEFEQLLAIQDPDWWGWSVKPVCCEQITHPTVYSEFVGNDTAANDEDVEDDLDDNFDDN